MAAPSGPARPGSAPIPPARPRAAPHEKLLPRRYPSGARVFGKRPLIEQHGIERHADVLAAVHDAERACCASVSGRISRLRRSREAAVSPRSEAPVTAGRPGPGTDWGPQTPHRRPGEQRSPPPRATTSRAVPHPGVRSGRAGEAPWRVKQRGTGLSRGRDDRRGSDLAPIPGDGSLRGNAASSGGALLIWPAPESRTPGRYSRCACFRPAHGRRSRRAEPNGSGLTTSSLRRPGK